MVPQPPPHVSGSFVQQGQGSRRASRVPQGSSRLQGETPAGPGRPQSSLPPRAAGRPHVSTEGPGRCHHGSEGAIPANRPPLGLTPCHCHTGSSGSQPVFLPRATPRGLSPSSSREPHAYDPGHQQPFSVQSNCFRQQHQTLSSECELCTCHLSGVICKKQMFEIIMHFSRNQGRFRLRGLLWETCIVLTESGRPLGSHT